MTKKKIVLVGIHYPFAILSYFREALEFRDDVELICAGIDTGNWIPWNGGMTLPQRYVKPVQIPFSKTSSHILNTKILASQLPWKPDLWLNVDAGCYLSEHPKDGILATVATDSHCLNYNHQRNTSDYFFNMHEHYANDEDYILPYCYAPRIHKPLDVEKIYDACAIGLHYDSRNMWVDKLRNAGVTVHYSIGQIMDEYNFIFNQSSVGMNWANAQDLNARHFELLAMKVPSVQYITPDADKYFESGIDYVGFRNLTQAIAGVIWLLEHPEEAHEIAEQGYESVQGHTYDARIQTIFETIGLEE